MSDVIILAAWLVWSLSWTLALRLGFAALARLSFKSARLPASLIAYVGAAIVIIASGYIHSAIFSPAVMYGGGNSLHNYLVAPFGLPLVAGIFLVGFGELVWTLFAPLKRANSYER